MLVDKVVELNIVARASDNTIERTLKKRMARPVCKRFCDISLISPRQRIRSQGIALAKMEIRTFRSS